MASIRLGTRASALARWQADWVAAGLRQLGLEVEMVLITTEGDRHRHGAIGRMGATGVFTKELQQALLGGQIDVAVHSLKDLPTAAVPGLCLAAVPERAPCGDALVSARFADLRALPSGGRVGTGSQRRRAQLLYHRPDLLVQELRGNVDTRLRKLDRGDYEAIVLAEAALERLGLSSRITQRLFPEVLLPAVGQGALGLETRSDDGHVRQAVAHLDHAPSHAAVLAERAMLAALEGGCLAPVAAWARMDGQRLVLTGRVVACDGSRQIEATYQSPPEAAAALGQQTAEALLAQGAAELIRAARQG